MPSTKEQITASIQAANELICDLADSVANKVLAKESFESVDDINSFALGAIAGVLVSGGLTWEEAIKLAPVVNENVWFDRETFKSNIRLPAEELVLQLAA